MWAEGSSLERLIDGVWFAAVVSRTGDPGLTGCIACIAYDDDGKTEEMVPLTGCRGLQTVSTFDRSSLPMLSPTMSWFDHKIAAGADDSFAKWLSQGRSGALAEGDHPKDWRSWTQRYTQLVRMYYHDHDHHARLTPGALEN